MLVTTYTIAIDKLPAFKIMRVCRTAHHRLSHHSLSGAMEVSYKQHKTNIDWLTLIKLFLKLLISRSIYSCTHNLTLSTYTYINPNFA